MKRVLLSSVFFSFCSFLNAQSSNPCPVAVEQTNNGGGNCPKIIIGGVEFRGTAEVTIRFNANVNPTCAPQLLALATDDGRPIIVRAAVRIISGANITYCIYGAPNENLPKNLGIAVQLQYPAGCFGLSGTTPTRCNASGIPLPVRFTSFSAQRKLKKVELKWSTASEQNNKGFTVQRNTGSQWVDVGFVPTTAASGISNTQLNYVFTDLSAGNGRTQYRILQTDFDGRTSFSDIRLVGAVGATASVSILPNPSTGAFTVLLDGSMGLQDVFVADMSGRTVRQYRNADQSIRVDNLQPGVYAIRVVDARKGTQLVEKAVVQ